MANTRHETLRQIITSIQIQIQIQIHNSNSELINALKGAMK